MMSPGLTWAGSSGGTAVSGRRAGIHAFVRTDTPLGTVQIAADSRGIREVLFVGPSADVPPLPGWREGGALVDRARRQLGEYFSGQRRQFDLPVSPVGTDFDRRVWEALALVPFGSTITYQELATRIGRPTATRAVGGANHRNPIAIVIPCHRVIGKNGRLVGYAGGLGLKERLLALEKEARVAKFPGLQGPDTDAQTRLDLVSVETRP